ncbi:hypothetical protein EVG20_g8052 [Dentipellis fragilis]|uniref:Uncharacterized protein n=1 Tax=Dentipellis fragilis TaxID=205917 RepID=A0A4Y9Y851_9AGAM|nr:hypothetical protein EVG20_g8052 [Dentipellis fragilis]
MFCTIPLSKVLLSVLRPGQLVKGGRRSGGDGGSTRTRGGGESRGANHFPSHRRDAASTSNHRLLPPSQLAHPMPPKKVPTTTRRSARQSTLKADAAPPAKKQKTVKPLSGPPVFDLSFGSQESERAPSPAPNPSQSQKQPSLSQKQTQKQQGLLKLTAATLGPAKPDGLQKEKAKDAKGKGKAVRIANRDLAKERPAEAVEGGALAAYDARNAYASRISDVRVEKIVVLGLAGRPSKVAVEGGRVLEWTYTPGVAATGKKEGAASVLTIKDPRVAVAADWEIVIQA